MVGDEMDYGTFALNLAAHRHHAGREHDAPLPLEHRGPDHQVGDAGLVLDSYEHDALRGSGSLPDQDEASRLQPPPVLRRHRLGTGDDPPPGQIGPEKFDRMAAQAEADVPVVLDDFAAGGHGPDGDVGFVEFGHRSGLAFGGGGPEL